MLTAVVLNDVSHRANLPNLAANRYQIVISNRAKIGGMKREQCLSPTGGRHEFDPDRIRAIDLHDRAKIVSAQSVGWNVPSQDDDIERLNGHLTSPG
jgi:hypothetical protein